MAKGINIEIGVDPKDAIDGISDVSDALEKIDDTLGDVGKSGSKDLEKVEKGLKEIDKASLQTGEKLDKTFRKDVKGATEDAADGMSDFKDEANQTARETAASFDGSAQSILDMFQELSANAFQGFGPAGVAAGLAAAAGIGLVTSIITDLETKAAESKARISEMANEFIDMAGVGVRGGAAIQEAMRQIITGGDDAVKSLEDVKKASGAIGIEWQTVAQAYAGNEDALDSVIKRTEEMISLTEEYQYSAKNLTEEDLQGLTDRKQALNNYKDELENTAREIKLAKEAEQEWLKSGGAEIVAKEELLSELNSAYDETASSVLDFVNKESGVLDVDAYLEAVAKRQKALLDYQTALAESGFTTEQKAALDSMGVEAAAAWMDGYQKTSEKNKAKMRNVLTEMASDSSGAAKDVVDKAFADPSEAVVKVDVNNASVQAAKRAIDKGITSGAYKIRVEAFDRNGKRVD